MSSACDGWTPGLQVTKHLIQHLLQSSLPAFSTVREAVRSEDGRSFRPPPLFLEARQE